MLNSLQSALTPRGSEAAGIAEIMWILLAGAAAIFLFVLVLTALALRVPRPWLGGKGMIVGGGIVFPGVVLFALLVYSLLASPRLSAENPAALAIEVIGRQWWWEVNYLDSQGEVDFTTANEIHLPVGRVVELQLRSGDVLHSFWVPALAGKLDMIPGKDNRLRLAADEPAVLRGQCAEYCGGPHALMALFVVTEAPEAFETWRVAQRKSHVQAAAGEAARGRRLFLAHCAACHTVRGTPAEGKMGPDLTHLASRRSIGAGILPNHHGTLAGWIGASQDLKPGNLMPEFRNFDGQELRALAIWLESLK